MLFHSGTAQFALFSQRSKQLIPHLHSEGFELTTNGSAHLTAENNWQVL
jgi:hypothetical protein